MKKILLILTIGMMVAAESMAQLSPIVLYSGGTNQLSYSYASGGANSTVAVKDSTGGPVTPYEGTSQYVFSFNVTSGYYAGNGSFNVNGWGSGPVQDYSGYTHLSLAVKSTGTTGSILNFQLTDNSATPITGPNVVVSTVATGSGTYHVVTFPLSSFVGNTGLDLSDVVYLGWSINGGNAAASGNFYVDDIKVVDNSVATGVSDKAVSINATIYPNPSSGFYTVTTSENIEKIQVTDSFGNIVLKSTNNNSTPQIDLTNHPDGLYFVTLSSNDKTVTKKLIKNR